MEIKEYDTWFELYGDDEFQWHFIADFDTREQAEEYARMSPVMGDYMSHRIKKCRGQA